MPFWFYSIPDPFKNDYQDHTKTSCLLPPFFDFFTKYGCDKFGPFWRLFTRQGWSRICRLGDLQRPFHSSNFQEAPGTTMDDLLVRQDIIMISQLSSPTSSCGSNLQSAPSTPKSSSRKTFSTGLPPTGGTAPLWLPMKGIFQIIPGLMQPSYWLYKWYCNSLKVAVLQWQREDHQVRKYIYILWYLHFINWKRIWRTLKEDICNFIPN